jgi:hypothetical protein
LIKQLQIQNILDLVLAINNRNTISDIEVIPGISDHDVVRFSINSRCRRKPKVNGKYIFERKRTRIALRIKKELQAFTENFDEACEGKSLNGKWDEFELTMRHIIDNCVLHKTS